MSDLDIEQKPSRRLWFFAGVTALALHVGGAALVLSHLQADEADDALGAPAIETGFEVMSHRVEATDLPPGPEADASVASPAQAEQKAELKEAELPKDTPAEVEDPDREVTPNETKKPVEEEKKIVAEASAPSQESVATATPSSETIRQGPRSVAPAQGPGNTARVRATWQKELSAHLEKHLRYPEHGLKTVEVLVSFVLDRRGHVLSASVVKGSGYPAFDEAALATLRRSDPVPPPPPLVADQGLSFSLPVIFRANGRS